MSHPEYEVKHMDGWTGEERRGIDGITLKLMAEVRATMEAHEKMEQRQFKVLEGEVAELSKQIKSLQASVVSFMDKTPDAIVDRIEMLIDEAFPADPDIPDATPSEKRKLHRKYHAKLISTALKEMERQDNLIDKLKAHIAQNAITLIGMALLAYFGLGVGK